MNEAWPWQRPEIAITAGTVAVCAVLAWAGGGVGESPEPERIEAAPVEQEVEVVPVPVPVESEPEPVVSDELFDLVGMIGTEPNADGGLVIRTMAGGAFVLDFGDAPERYDARDSVEWHVVARLADTGKVGGMSVVEVESIRPFSEGGERVVERVVERIVEVPVEVPAAGDTGEKTPTAPVEVAPASPTLVTLEGTIDSNWAAIGGETTGAVIREASNAVTEIDLSAVRGVYEGTPNREFVNWVATGVLEEREYTTRGVVPTLRVTELKTGGS